MTQPLPIPPRTPGPWDPRPRGFGLREIGILAVLALTLAVIWHELKDSVRLTLDRHLDSQPYASCAQARADGASPLSADNPRFNPALDRDGDGWACEPPPKIGLSV